MNEIERSSHKKKKKIDKRKDTFEIQILLCHLILPRNTTTSIAYKYRMNIINL